MNYNPKMGFSEQDYHLLKTHQSSGSGSKPYELVTTKTITSAEEIDVTINVDNLNDIIVFLSIPAVGSTALATDFILTFNGNKLSKKVYQISCSKTATTTHAISFNNTNGVYELSYSTPASGTLGSNQKGWSAKTSNASYNNTLGSFTQIPVNQILLEIDVFPPGGQYLPVNTKIEVYAR